MRLHHRLLKLKFRLRDTTRLGPSRVWERPLGHLAG